MSKHHESYKFPWTTTCIYPWRIQTVFTIAGTTNPNTQRELLAYHLKKQHILRIKRGLFASIPMSFRHSVDNFPVEPYLVAGRIRKDAVISYLSALDFHGVSYSLHHQYYFMSESVITPLFNKSQFKLKLRSYLFHRRIIWQDPK